MSFITYQDFIKNTAKTENKAEYVRTVIDNHRGSPMFRIALDANEYDHQRNITILEFVNKIMSHTGVPMIDITASNTKLTSNFFRQLNKQRNMYSLGNGITFPRATLKANLGNKFDTQIQKAGYKALIHGVSFVFWNLDKLYVFPLTEFAPLWDEDTGALGAGARFWQIASDKPLFAVLYELDGYTKYRSDDSGNGLVLYEDKRPYREKTRYSPADGTETIGGDNYSSLPIIPLWGSELRQSTLVGMRQSIDSYDLIRSGFANDLSDCAQIYWILENCGGMSEEDLSRFRENLMFRHIANVNSEDGAQIKPYTQEIPFQARSSYLDRIRAGIYEDFGGLDVHTIAAGATNDHIDAAYQPLDDNADDYEYQIIECVQQVLALQGITGTDATPQFKRNRISNQKEQVEMVVLEAPYLDDETILSKLPNVTSDEVKSILKRKDAEGSDKFNGNEDDEDDDEPSAGGEV